MKVSTKCWAVIRSEVAFKKMIVMNANQESVIVDISDGDNNRIRSLLEQESWKSISNYKLESSIKRIRRRNSRSARNAKKPPFPTARLMLVRSSNVSLFT